ncbi:hypothetical protein Pelo_15457 [Pelomyxa schiedti]|nr:hypothetical protein Pelo_15457 [Pelomyxa schiedti]
MSFKCRFMTTLILVLFFLSMLPLGNPHNKNLKIQSSSSLEIAKLVKVAFSCITLASSTKVETLHINYRLLCVPFWFPSQGLCSPNQSKLIRTGPFHTHSVVSLL